MFILSVPVKGHKDLMLLVSSPPFRAVSPSLSLSLPSFSKCWTSPSYSLQFPSEPCPKAQRQSGTASTITPDSLLRILVAITCQHHTHTHIYIYIIKQQKCGKKAPLICVRSCQILPKASGHTCARNGLATSRTANGCLPYVETCRRVSMSPASNSKTAKTCQDK